MMRWQDIWNKRNIGLEEAVGLADLIRLDGFDAGAGAISAQVWKAYVERRASDLGLQAGDLVFEIGCGAGAFAWPLFERGCVVAGIDYSASLIRVARNVMPGGQWHVAHANEVELAAKSYDVVVANSVFHYFPDKSYARQVLGQMLVAARRAVGILDIPDGRLAERADDYRRAALGAVNYRRRYNGLQHLSFTPDWFTRAAPDWRVQCTPQDIGAYGNNEFRFNVIMKRYG